MYLYYIYICLLAAIGRRVFHILNCMTECNTQEKRFVQKKLASMDSSYRGHIISFCENNIFFTRDGRISFCFEGGVVKLPKVFMLLFAYFSDKDNELGFTCTQIITRSLSWTPWSLARIMLSLLRFTENQLIPIGIWISSPITTNDTRSVQLRLIYYIAQLISQTRNKEKRLNLLKSPTLYDLTITPKISSPIF